MKRILVLVGFVVLCAGGTGGVGDNAVAGFCANYQLTSETYCTDNGVYYCVDDNAGTDDRCREFSDCTGQTSISVCHVDPNACDE